MIDRKSLALKAYYHAVKIKKINQSDLIRPINIYDFVERNGVEVRFTDTKSVEGIYSKNPGPIIIIGAYRPRGRQIFTCAHEFGHHIMDHGSKVDEIIEKERIYNEEEFLADCFAGFFLMPREAIFNYIELKKINLAEITPQDIYALSCYLGVGYKTLVTHLYSSLSIISNKKFVELNKVSKKKILQTYLDGNINDLVIVDTVWSSPVDILVGDILLVPDEIEIENDQLEILESNKNGKFYLAKKTGIGRLYNINSDWAIFLRVSRREFIGRNKYKHLEETDE